MFVSMLFGRVSLIGNSKSSFSLFCFICFVSRLFVESPSQETQRAFVYCFVLYVLCTHFLVESSSYWDTQKPFLICFVLYVPCPYFNFTLWITTHHNRVSLTGNSKTVFWVYFLSVSTISCLFRKASFMLYHCMKLVPEFWFEFRFLCGCDVTHHAVVLWMAHVCNASKKAEN